MGCIQRMNTQHDLLKGLLDGNYVDPVRDHLARRSSQRQIRVLDLCTGTGKWYVTPYIFILWPNRRCHLRRVVEMAEEFPHVKFNGLDIGMWVWRTASSQHTEDPDAAPISTRSPPENVIFEVHDITTRTRFPDSSFDFVHARHCSLLPVCHLSPHTPFFPGSSHCTPR